MEEGILEVTDANFEESILNAGKPALVDFWATWCGPCRAIGPIVEELGKEYEGKAIVGKLNVDDNQQTASKYGVMSIPAVLIFKNGEVAESLIGARNKSAYATALDSHLSD